MMRILLVNHRYFPAEGGTERWTRELAHALHRKGVEVAVLTQQEPGVPAEETVEGVQVHRLGMWRAGKFRIPKGYWRRLRDLDHDLLHLSGNRIWCADFYFPMVEVLGGHRVVTPHGFYQLEMQPNRLNRWYFGRYLPLRLSSFDACLASTDREVEQLTRFGVPDRKVQLMGDGVDLGEFANPPPELGLRKRGGFTRPLIGLYVGGMWENKRVDRLVRGLAPVRDLVALAVIGKDVPGNPSDQAQVSRLAQELGVEVKFLGVLERAQVLAAYREADLYLQGSQYEGFGLSLMEAMASGLPFVAYDAGAARLMSRSGGGHVARDEEEFARSVAELTRDPAIRDTMGRAAEKEARRWDWDVLVDRYLALYRRVLGEGGSTAS